MPVGLFKCKYTLTPLGYLPLPALMSQKRIHDLADSVAHPSTVTCQATRSVYKDHARTSGYLQTETEAGRSCSSER